MPSHSFRATIFHLFLILPSALSLPHYFPISRSCGTSDPSDDLRSSLADLREAETQENDLWNSTLVDSRIAKRQSQPTPSINVDTYFHIVTDSSAAQTSDPNYVTPTMIQNQLSYLQNAYSKYGITFTLKSTDRTVNATWASNNDDTAMKKALRQGTYSSLNVYFQSQLQATASTPGVPAGEILLGFCSLPSAGITPSTPVGTYYSDGCNILSSSMTGGTLANYNLGGTCTHETGHWFGLLHTFNDYTCSPYDYGDYVADTPQQSISTNGCPSSTQDSCPNSGAPAGYTGVTNSQVPTGNPYGPQGYAGADLIHNFMDYSSDACYEGFTSGQAARMINLWGLYRLGN